MKLEKMLEWIGPGIVEEISSVRKESGESRRDGKIGTAEMIFLFLSVALNTEKRSIHEILRQCSFDSGEEWNVSPAGFCKARSRFSPRASA